MLTGRFRPGVLIPTTVLLLVGTLAASGCGADQRADSPAPSARPPSSAPTPSQSGSTDDAVADAVAEVEAVEETGDGFLDAFAAYDQILRTFVQAGPGTFDRAEVQGGAETYTAAEREYADAVNSLQSGLFVENPDVAAAFDAYSRQVEDTIDSRDAGVLVTYTYGLCDLSFEISLLQVAGHAQAADACLETIRPMLSNGYPEVASYAKAMTKLMKTRKRIYSGVADKLEGFTPPDTNALDPDQLQAAGDQFGEYGRAAEQAGTQLTAAFDTFFPTLKALLDDGGLQELYDASSVDASRTALIAALEASAD